MRLYWFLALLFIMACSSNNGTEGSPDASGVVDVAVGEEVTLDVQVHLKDAGTDAGQDLTTPDFTAPETTPDINAAQCNPGEGCFGDKCANNSACQSGWCVEHMGEGVCTQACQDECPAGWSCQQVAGTEPDVVFVCVSDFANLCKPCATGADCGSIGSQDVCVDYGEEGSFCGGACDPDAEQCPWGFACQEVATVEGAATFQCLAEAGVCPCTDKSATLSLSTPCLVENEFGLCGGHRLCTADGLTDCDANVPAPEECNGADDNCNGVKDEGTCDDGLQCTMDSCEPQAGCVNQPLDSGECVDGNPCTAADHCVAGECVGAPVLCDDKNPCTDDLCDELGGCLFEPNKEACDDADPCTVGDHCDDSQCVGVDAQCGCATDADCLPLDDANLCNGTLFCDQSKLPFVCATVPDSQVQCPEPEGVDAPCLKAVCMPDTGDCSLEPDHQGFACNDEDACTSGETCQDGSCAQGLPLNCNDGNPCTNDSCDQLQGCQHSFNTLPCQDGDPCTLNDVCAQGECMGGQPMACNDQNQCTDDSCDPATGCVFKPNQATCSDFNPCTITDHCEAGACVPAGMLDCNDDNLCTNDSCSAQQGCVHTMNTAPCDDGNACTINDKCANGWCLGQGASCEDFNPCTNDSCTQDEGCVHEPNDSLCNDGSLCTVGDHCNDGTCQGTQLLECDDNDPCTDDNCNPSLGCVHTLNQAPCNDGDPCTVDDKCGAGLCKPGITKQCDDNVDCTTDTCDGDCIHTPVDAACDDANQCTADTCDPVNGCTHTLPPGPCDDGDPCTKPDFCQLGLCLPGPLTDCDDKNPCTEDSCDGNQGCLHAPVAGQCNDGDPCTDGDQCQLGECIGPVPVICNDNIPCTVDSCVPMEGCSFLPDDALCDNDNLCTTDTCSPDTGCEYGPAPGPCDGGQCVDGECVLDCVSQCAGKECGADGCDGDCGKCLAGFNCVAGKCLEPGSIECNDGNDILWDGCTAGKISEFRVNTFTPGEQTYPDVAGLPGGGYVVVWASYDQDGEYMGIYGQRFANDGAFLGEEFQVNTYTTSYQNLPAVASIGQGRFMVVWQSANQDGSSYGIYSQRYNSDGTPLGGEFRVNSQTSQDQTSAAIAGLDDGSAYVAFRSYPDGNGYGVFGRRVSPDGVPLDSDKVLNSYTTNTQDYPALTSHAGGFVAVWQSYEQDTSNWGVYGRRLGTDGSFNGPEFKIHTYTPSDQQLPSVAAAADGSFVSVWQSYNEDGSGLGVYCQRFTPDATKIKNPFRVNTYIVSHQERPDVASWPDGRFVVVWASHAQDGDGSGIYGQMYNVDGTPSGTEFQVNTYTAYTQYYSEVTTLDGAGFVVTWNSQAQDDSVSGVFAQRYDTAGNKLYH